VFKHCHHDDSKYIDYLLEIDNNNNNNNNNSYFIEMQKIRDLKIIFVNNNNNINETNISYSCFTIKY